MIDKYVKAWKNYQRKADEEWHAYGREVKAKTSDECEWENAMSEYS